MDIPSKAIEFSFLLLLSLLPAPEQVDNVVRPYAQTAAAIVTVAVGLVQLSKKK